MFEALLLALAAIQSVFLQSFPTVTLKSGTLQGSVYSSSSGNPYYAFLSIPYAQPPIGPLRFKPPQAFGQWNGVLNATSVGPECPQVDLINNYVGDEDCLYLNVYVHQQNGWPRELLPVLFYIHGGGNVDGSGRYIEYGPQNFMDHPVVLVVINYRLSALGFLSTNDSNAYGNYALLDQAMAMKWVQDNIIKFGGDPSRVTLFGDSAGSASVVHHVLSQRSKGLFARAISESGTALNYWAVQPDSLYQARRVAAVLNCNYNDTKDLVHCLCNKTAKEIILAANQFQTTPFIPVNWAAVVEAPGGPGFLTEMPISIIKNNRIANRVPLIIGHTALEGYTLFWDLEPTYKYNDSEYFEKQFPEQLSLIAPIQANMTSVIEAIANEYYKNVDLNNATVFTYVLSEIIGDAYMTAAISQAAELFSEAGLPVYAYIYDHIGQYCLASAFRGPCGIYTSHGDEIFVQFRYMSPDANLNQNDTAMSYILNSLWVDFGSQSSHIYINRDQMWPLYTKSNPRYVQLNLSPTIRSGTLSNETTFWTETIPKLIRNYTLSHR